MPKQKGEIVSLGINYSEVLKQELDTAKKKGKANSPAKKKGKKDEESATEDDLKGMMSLF